MTPAEFFDVVVVPNLQAVDDQPNDIRICINAILTLDAAFGMLFEPLRRAGHPDCANLTRDDAFRDRIAARCPGYAAVRDAAATLKHGALTLGSKPRVIRTVDQIQSTEIVLGLLAIDDDINGHVIVLNHENGVDAVRADDAMIASCCELRQLLGLETAS